MTSSVEIANRALSKLGAARITSLDDDNKPARAMKARYTLLRDAELEAYPWRFAIKLTSLPALASAPLYGYANAYQRPFDDLRPISIGDHPVLHEAVGVVYAAGYTYQSGTAPFEIIGQEIHSDFGPPLKYQYVQRVTDSGFYPPLFVEALACRLAADAAEELTQNAGKYDRAVAMYDRAIAEARRVNAMYRPPSLRTPGRFILSRLHG